MATYARARIETWLGDITQLEVDAIVNAANASLLGGGGVDGAIHEAAGPGLLDECRGLGGARPGEAKATGGYALPARYVIHTVGPVWHGGHQGEDEVLARCYRESLRVASGLRLRSIAFPAISTGAFRFPLERATGIALTEAQRGLAAHPDLQRIVFCCFGRTDLDVYDAVARSLFGE
ncbi:O-acetyl-ADP-ribose deacetylase [Anaeromyxobacter diazotrophicus]|nr:O-acetyl-ADP-ribose deacetylase [Anaeromyxobacter diazotrophicus]